MKNMTITLFLSFLFFGAPAMAGSGHDHDHGHGHSHGPISSDAVILRASVGVKRLAKTGKIDASWSKVKASGAEKKTFAKGKGPEWVVTFKNPKVNDSKKQNLYLFFSLDGHYIAANYTGK